MRLRLALAGLLVVAITSSGCSYGSRAEVERIVRDYCALLPTAYARGDAELVKPLTTSAEQDRIAMYMLYLRKEKKAFLDTRLLDVRVTRTSFDEGGKSATVVTEERWRWRLLDIATHDPRAPYRTDGYRATYSLKLQDGRWVVSGLDVSGAGQGSR